MGRIESGGFEINLDLIFGKRERVVWVSVDKFSETVEENAGQAVERLFGAYAKKDKVLKAFEEGDLVEGRYGLEQYRDVLVGIGQTEMVVMKVPGAKEKYVDVVAGVGAEDWVRDYAWKTIDGTEKAQGEALTRLLEGRGSRNDAMLAADLIVGRLVETGKQYRLGAGGPVDEKVGRLGKVVTAINRMANV